MVINRQGYILLKNGNITIAIYLKMDRGLLGNQFLERTEP